MVKSIAIIGAGPIGLEAALFAVRAGYRTDVYERGRVAENVNRWGHVRLFSPFGMNISTWGREAIAAAKTSKALPGDDQLLTGREFASQYLIPLSQVPELAGHIHEQTEVRAISRERTWKRDLIGKAERRQDPFRLLLNDISGERIVDADCVLDCSGTYPNHNWIGAGGIPAIGETRALVERDYELPDILGSDRASFAGRKTLVVGGGYSAATAVVLLASVADTDPATKIVWITRTKRDDPLIQIANDSLAERDALAFAANCLATAQRGPVEWISGRTIQAVDRSGRDQRYRITTTRGEEIVADRVIANVGYRPDRRLYEELQVHECYASGGTMKLAAALLGEKSADCVAQSSHGAQTLVNPEPGFFVLGSKSYGRDSRFLLKIGIEQVRDVFALLAEMK